MNILFWPKTHIILKLSFLFLYVCFASKVDASFQLNLVSFTENKGQLSDQYYKPRPDVLFNGTYEGMGFYLRNNGISYQLNRVESWKEKKDFKTNEVIKRPDQIRIFRVDVNWLGANTFVRTETDRALEGHTNYYLTNCPNGVHDVKSFTGVTFKNIYTNIDLHYYQKEGKLKYDYLVQPNADYKQIRLEIRGVETVTIQKDGSVLLKTPLGDIVEDAPLVYQNNKQLKARWILSKNILSFEIENYDPNQFLVIDPAVRVWGTYYGGLDSEDGLTTSTDPQGNVYLGGVYRGYGNSNLVTSGAHQTIAAGQDDGFLVKFSAAGNRLWATYYGGNADDGIYSSSTDASGNVFVAGNTSSGLGIASTNGYQTVLIGGGSAFLAKFDNNGVRKWATYYGGNLWQQGNSCCTDKLGNVYLAGFTSQDTNQVISTNGSHQASSGGLFDAYLVKFNTNGIRQWGTFYGGAGLDWGTSCVTDLSNNVYLVGYTDTNIGTSIATPSSHQSIYGGGSGGNYDAFVVKFNSSGVRQWGSYYGGVDDDRAFTCATDKTGGVFIAGETKSYGNISSLGAHQPSLGYGIDGFLVKLNTNGTRIWATYYGGTCIDNIYGCVCDPSDNVYIVGKTCSIANTVIATPGSQQPVFNGVRDAFLAKFNQSGIRQFGTYYGGVDQNSGNACSADPGADIVYLAGTTEAMEADVISSSNGYQPNYGGSGDAFLAKFQESAPVGLTQEYGESWEELFQFYPNPADNAIEIMLTENLTDSSELEIFNSLGELILFKELNTRHSVISLNDFSKGIYFIKVVNHTNLAVQKLIKE